MEVLHAFEKACGHEIPYKMGPRRSSDLPEYYAATGKAERIFGWKTVRDIDDMCRDGWNYFKNNYEKK